MKTVDEEIEESFALRLQLLDDAHRRATSPKARKRIERTARRMQAELENIRAKAKLVDLAYERWVRQLNAILGE